MGRRHASHEAVVDAPPQACFDALLDYERFPEWQREVKSAEVLARDDQGRGRDVGFEIDANVRTIRYTLRYAYEPPHRIAWEYLDGDVKDVDGDFVLEDRGDGSTLAVYTLALDPGVWLPGPVLRVLNDQVMKGAVEDLKRRVEGG